MQHGTSREVSAVLVQGLSWCQVVAAELYPGLWPEVHLHRWQQELLAVNGGQQQQRRHEALDDGSGLWRRFQEPRPSPEFCHRKFVTGILPG